MGTNNETESKHIAVKISIKSSVGLTQPGKINLITIPLQNLVTSKQNYFKRYMKKKGFVITKNLILKIK